jgi:hypothetical protein
MVFSAKYFSCMGVLMFKKFFGLYLCFNLGLAQASQHSELKDAYDELHYALTVEWDQRDSEFYQQQLTAFGQKLDALGPVAFPAVASIIQEQIKDHHLSNSLLAALEAGLRQQSPDAIRYLLHTALSKTYSSGASWNDQALLTTNLALLNLMLLVVILNKKDKKESP